MSSASPEERMVSRVTQKRWEKGVENGKVSDEVKKSERREEGRRQQRRDCNDGDHCDSGGCEEVEWVDW